MPKRRVHRAQPRDGIHYRELTKLKEVGDIADDLVEPGKQNVKSQRKAKRVDFGRLDNNEVETPDNVLDDIRAEFGSFFDPCPFMGKGKLPEFDALKEEELSWQEFNFVNPPYDDIGPWTERAYNEMVKRNYSTLVLVPARTGSAYWRDTVWNKCTELRFVTGKIIFKGYNHPSPHQLCCIIYRSEPERIAQSTNVVWPITKVLRDVPAMRAQYPDLWHVVSKARDVQGNYCGRPMTWSWMQGLITADEFIHQLASGELSEIIKTLILPLYGQMLRFMHNQGYLKEHSHVSRRAFALPELLRRIAYQMTTDTETMDHLLNLPLTIQPEYEEYVVSFYEAFMENGYRHCRTANRTHEPYHSYDTEFSLQCIEFK